MLKKLPKRVYICECWGRDGLQNIPKVIPTVDKIEMINNFAKAGYARIETTSFSNPKRLPQFADSEEILKKIERVPGVSYKATCINEKALDRAVEAVKNGYGPNEVSFMISVSEAHNLANAKLSHKEHWEQISRMMKLALDNKLRVMATLGTVYGCPIAGDVAQSEVVEFVKRYVDLGATWVVLGDTTGSGNPVRAHSLFTELLDKFPGITFVAHFHDTRGTGLANCLAAIDAGVIYFDSALGGIGGQPSNGEKYHHGFSGNVCSEDLICMLEEMGISTGIKQEEVIRLGLLAEEKLGEKQRSNVIRCGAVKH